MLSYTLLGVIWHKQWRDYGRPMIQNWSLTPSYHY
jgi:hypothetical protein